MAAFAARRRAHRPGLVLSRKVDEEIVVLLPDGRQVVATVVEIRGDKVRLHWVADGDIKIHRREVYEEILAEAAVAAGEGAA